jgi:soluble lytic murein transglycosylase-like protein
LLGWKPVLEQTDVDLYRRIFALQAEQKLREADQAIGRLNDPLLLGHVYAQRLLAGDALPPADKLAHWLKSYADHPDAAAIQALARRAGIDARHARISKTNLVNGEDDGPPDDTPYLSPRHRSGAEASKVRALMTRITRLARAGDLDAAAKLLDAPDTLKKLDSVERAMTQARLAQGYYFAGNLTRALDEAEAAAPIARTESPVADWVAGLSLWRMGKPEYAADHFEAVSRSPKSDAWLASAGAFWASRAELLARRPERVAPLLARAAEQGRTFYGLLAARQLGIEDRFNWGLPTLSPEASAKLARFDGVKRAVALVEIGQQGRAEAELAQVQGKVDPSLRRPLLAMARRLDLAAAQLRIAGHVMSEGDVFDAALYPIPNWRPAGGFTVDRAFIYALMRQESRFDPGAQNGRSGAMGLMQIMPETARHLSSGTKVAVLSDPATNLAMGQRYIEGLVESQGAARNLFLVAAAYNAGPGNLSRWRDVLKDVDDPLLFIESIPAGQTRAFVARISANYWIYRMRLGLDVPSLDAAAAGKWPLFAGPGEDVKVRMVRN